MTGTSPPINLVMDPTRLTSQKQGLQFEKIFERLCGLQGFLARKIPLSARIIGNGRILPIKSELDYIILHPDYPTAFLDTKTFAGRSFAFSQINPHQIKLAYQYCNWGSIAGLIVWFRESNRVIYFSGEHIQETGAGHSFTDDQGIMLGSVPTFSLKKIFR